MMSKFGFLKTFCAVFLVCAGLARAEEAPLVIDSNSRLEILLPGEPTPAENYAAFELADHLGKMMSKAIPIRQGEGAGNGNLPIFVGWHPQNKKLSFEKLETEESVVDVERDSIHLVGGRGFVEVNGKKTLLHDRGTLYAVYDLLESLGVRWYRPDPWGTYIPDQPRITLPIGIEKHRPVYKYRRGISGYRYYKDESEEQRQWGVVWAVRNRFNCNMSQAADKGGSYGVNFDHSYFQLVPHDRYFKTHPEYFALIGGKRSSDPNAQLCLGNPEVQKLVAEQILHQAECSPFTEVYSIDPNDGSRWCECPLCKAMDDPNLKAQHGGGVSMTNRVAKFGNIIAKALAEKYPEKKVAWLAYNKETEVPTLVNRLEPNTVVIPAAFAGSWSDYSRNLDDPASPQNKAFREVLNGYSKLTDSMMTYEYWSFYVWPGPMPIVHTLVDRLRSYAKDFGIKGVYSETHECWGPQGLDYYVMAKLLYDPFRDVDALLADYYTHFYGPAAEPMRRYHEKLEAAAQNGVYFGSGGFGLEKMFTDALLAEVRPDLEEAVSKTNGKEPYERRMKGVAAGFEYARRCREILNLEQNGKLKEAAAALAKLKEFFFASKDGEIFDNGPKLPFAAGHFSYFFSDLEKQGKLVALFDQPEVLQVLDKGWGFRTDPQNVGLRENWAAAPTGEAWKPIAAGLHWQEQGYSTYRGVAWYGREFANPSGDAGNRTILFFDAVDGSAEVYLNGTKLGSHPLGPGGEGWDQPFYFDITDQLAPGKRSTLAVRVEKFGSNFAGITKSVKILSAKGITPPR